MDRNIPRVATQPEGGWEGDQDLDQLYRRYAPWLEAMLRKRFGQGLEAEDVVQETYVRLAPHDPANIRRPQALLMRVAVNLAKDVLRRRAVRARFADQGRQVEVALPMVGAPLDDLLLKEAILSIPEAYRDIFILSRFHGMTYEEIATRCGLSVKAVEWRLSKAISHCTTRQLG